MMPNSQRTEKQAYIDFCICEIETEIQEQTDNGWIMIPDTEREDFIDSLIAECLDYVDFYHEGCFVGYRPNFADLVSDFCDDCGYTII